MRTHGGDDDARQLPCFTKRTVAFTYANTENETGVICLSFTPLSMKDCELPLS